MLHKLQYISQGSTPEQHIKNIREVLNAGVKLIQLRLKNVNQNIYSEAAGIVKETCEKHEARLIINDDPFVARHCNAYALHLGLNDMRVAEAKKIVNEKIIGGTANTFDHVKTRCAENVSYIGLGPFRFTTTKDKLSPVLGVSGYNDILTKMKAANLTTPVYAIGGIELNDIESLMGTGIHGIAVSGLLTNSPDKEKLVKEINKKMNHV